MLTTTTPIKLPHSGQQWIQAIQNGTIDYCFTIPAYYKLCINPCSDTQLDTIINYLVDNELNQEVIELVLCHYQLNQIPSEIGQLSALTRLFLRNNQLTQIPSEIG